MAEKSTKPYLIRAIHEWCSDSNFTPYLSVKVDANTRVPMEYVKNGEIVLNVSYDATHSLTIGNELMQFSARFNGVSRECSSRSSGSRASSRARTARAHSSPSRRRPRWRRRPPRRWRRPRPMSEPPKPPAAGKSRLKLVK